MQFYNWKAKYGGMEANYGKRLKELEDENIRLKKLFAEVSLENHAMTEISLAWLLTKVTAPVVGATKKHHIDGVVKAVDLILSEEELLYLEACYQPHSLTGVMAQNRPQTTLK